MKETTIKRKFQKLFSDDDSSYSLLKEIIPKSAKTKVDRIKQVKFSSLKNKEIISVYEKCSNVKYLLTKQRIHFLDYNGNKKYINADDESWTKYEIYCIDSERIGIGELIGPILYKYL